MVRPTLPDDEKRAYQTPSIRLTEEENSLFHDLVFQSELSKTDFIRHAIFNKKISVIKTQGLNFDARNELRRLGNNLNQIAYRMNATGQHAPPILDDLLRGINQTLMEALEDIKEDREP